MPKTTVSSPAATASRSAAALFLNRNTALAIPQTNADTNSIIADGTWK
jgi:hypothetical protein